MTLILALGLVWLLLATVLATVLGRAIRLADLRSQRSGGLDRLLAGAQGNVLEFRAVRAGFDGAARSV